MRGPAACSVVVALHVACRFAYHHIQRQICIIIANHTSFENVTLGFYVYYKF